MSHLFYDGTIYHKRFFPKIHEFTYPFFLLDIDVQDIATLKNRLFSFGKFNLFSFFTKDHFGTTDDFVYNARELLKEYGIEEQGPLRFLTLPRIANFVFNPISVLIVFNEHNIPKNMLVEVHNYNGGRVVYPVELNQVSLSNYKGSVKKDMYVSPFLDREGEYKFSLHVGDEKISLSVVVYQEDKKILVASFDARMRVFSEKSIAKLFLKHTFLTFWVVTRTLWQSTRLYFKGLKFIKVTPIDQIRRK